MASNIFGDAFYVTGDTKVLQQVSFLTGAVNSGSGQIPEDDTIPQITEGNEFMTLSITPKSASSKLRIDVVFHGGLSGIGLLTVALFKDSTANAIGVSSTVVPGNQYQQNIVFSTIIDSGATAATTFKVRAGSSTAVTTTFNGSAATAKFGGTYRSSIIITELEA